jgi:hypothetical protein
MSTIHLTLKLEIEPEIDEDTFTGVDLMKIAEKKDHVLRLAGKYKTKPKAYSNTTLTEPTIPFRPRNTQIY